MHPSIFISRKPDDERRISAPAVEDVKRAITEGHPRRLWKEISARAETDLKDDPLTPGSMFEGRDSGSAQCLNRDYTICQAVGTRLKQFALCALLGDDTRYTRAALKQYRVLFDTDVWPRWRDKAESHQRHAADLRTGQLGRDCAVAFDWLYESLSESERAEIISGIDRMAIVPFLESVEEDAWWLHSGHNWTTCIVGGLGIAGMALYDHHPRAPELVERSLPIMNDYVETAYGPDGEFNESVGYAASSNLAVVYFSALDSWGRAPHSSAPVETFERALTWYMYFTVPPGRNVAFGDSHLNAPPEVSMYTALSTCTRGPVFQWFYLNHLSDALRRNRTLELLWFDPTVTPQSPEGVLPRGRSFGAYGACISSRSAWDPRRAETVVAGKAAIERNHQHHDAGQVVIDGYGRRLIADLGSPSAYPPDFFGEYRWRYYNASARGHNVPIVGDREPPYDRPGRVISDRFDDAVGGYWVIDLSPCYRSSQRLYRTVVHLYPNVVIVVDDIRLDTPEEISLRWHTAAQPDLSGDRRFSVRSDNISMAAAASALRGPACATSLCRHSYTAPHDRDRNGFALEQRREPYVELRARTAEWTVLSAFCVFGPAAALTDWSIGSGRLGEAAHQVSVVAIDSPSGPVSVDIAGRALRVTGGGAEREIRVRLPG